MDIIREKCEAVLKRISNNFEKYFEKCLTKRMKCDIIYKLSQRAVADDP